MDLTRRAMLNDFGLVQHAVFETADHNAVHVIYRHTQKTFVHTELTKELETPTGLQLVPAAESCSYVIIQRRRCRHCHRRQSWLTHWQVVIPSWLSLWQVVIPSWLSHWRVVTWGYGDSRTPRHPHTVPTEGEVSSSLGWQQTSPLYSDAVSWVWWGAVPVSGRHWP